MPVPCVGFSAQNSGFSGVKRRNCEKWRTVSVRSDCIQSRFGALMIGDTITG
jgi:hypothetical protein